MSVWTQINGCIRIDGIEVLDPSMNKKVLEILGRTCSFEDPEEAWDACTVPCGSEGSLQYKVLKVGGGLVLYTVPIWGDLRDYDDEQEIIDWFNRVTVDNGLMIRSAVLEYQIGNKAAQVLRYENKFVG